MSFIAVSTVLYHLSKSLRLAICKIYFIPARMDGIASLSGFDRFEGPDKARGGDADLSNDFHSPESKKNHEFSSP